MRMLAADIGNSDSVFGIYREGRREQVWRFATEDGFSADSWAARLQPLMSLAGISMSEITTVVVANVRDAAYVNFCRFCEKYLRVKLLTVGEGELANFINTDLAPQTKAGADRLVNAWWAHRRYSHSAVVVDFGTANNFDIVDADGVYQGGLIVAGLEISSQALADRAAKLVPVKLVRNPPIIGKDTVTALQSGAYWGHLSMIEGILDRIKVSGVIADNFRVVATGGLSHFFESEKAIFDQIDPFFTLDGVAALSNEFLSKA